MTQGIPLDVVKVVGRRIKYCSSRTFEWKAGIVLAYELGKDGAPPHKIKIQMDEDGVIKWREYPSNKVRILTEEQVSESNKEMLQKVMKLLRLAGSPNKHEAELAMQRAHELMHKYDIKQEDIDGTKGKAFEDEVVPLGGSIFQEYWCVAKLCQEFFNVQFFCDHLPGREKGMRFIGKKHHVEISLYVFAFLAYTFREIHREENRIERVQDRNSFMMGLYQGLKSKLTESNKKIEQEYGIVVVENTELKKYVADKWKLKDVKTGSSRGDADSYSRGQHRGKNININEGISDKTAGSTLRIGGK